MACEVVCAPGAVFAVWGEPGLSDITWALEILRSQVRRAGHPVLYVTRVPVAAPAPPANVRRCLDEAMTDIVACCSTYHVVLEGGGVLSALKRGVLTGLFQVRPNRENFFVHSSIGEVVAKVPPAAREAAMTLVQRARDYGLLEPSYKPATTRLLGGSRDPASESALSKAAVSR